MDGVEGWENRLSLLMSHRKRTRHRRRGKIINKNSCWLIWVHIGTLFFVSCGSFFTVIGALAPQSISSPLPFCKSGKLVFLSGNWWVLTNLTHSPNRFFFHFIIFFLFFPLTFLLAGVCSETKRQCVETAPLNKTRLGDGVWDMTGDTQLLEVGKLLKYLKPARYVLHKNEY